MTLDTSRHYCETFWDIFDGWLTDREWPGQHLQFLRCFHVVTTPRPFPPLFWIMSEKTARLVSWYIPNQGVKDGTHLVHFTNQMDSPFLNQISHHCHCLHFSAIGKYLTFFVFHYHFLIVSPFIATMYRVSPQKVFSKMNYLLDQNPGIFSN